MSLASRRERERIEAAPTNTGMRRRRLTGEVRADRRGVLRARDARGYDGPPPRGAPAQLPPQPTELRIVRIGRITRIVQRQKG